MKYGYVRVSESDTEEFFELQMQQLREQGCSDERIFIERRSGTAGHRPAYNALMDSIEKGDEVITWSLDRIGRSIDHVAELCSALKDKGASLRTLGEGSENLDTSELSNTQHYRLFDLFARFRTSIDNEREQQNKKRRNPNRGQSAGLLLSWAQIEHAQKIMASREYPVSQLCRELGVSPPTLYEYVGPTGELRSRGERIRRLFGPRPSDDDIDVAEAT